MATSLEEGEINEQCVTLTNMFQAGLDLYNNVGKIDEPTNSPNVQINVRKSMKLLEDSTRLVSVASVFSRNEGINEVSTENIKYFLLPALLGSLCLKLTAGDRKDILDAAETYFKDFLQRCNDYGLSNYEFKDDNKVTAKETTSEFEKIQISVNTRATKIQRFREQKELKDKLEVLKQNLKNEHVDEDVKREFYLNMIKLFVYESIDELSCIESEKPILAHLATINKGAPPPKRPPVTRLKPIIITKDVVQKAVFGAGYPSLPTYTVAEFYDQRVRDGIFPDPTKPKTGPMSMQDAAAAGVALYDSDDDDAQMEKKVQEDDDENLARLRAKDEFKDEHRRGWGNRMNRS